MNLRTITCLVVYSPKRRAIVNGFRTKKDLIRWFPDGVPMGCVVVKMKGHYLRRIDSAAKTP